MNKKLCLLPILLISSTLLLSFSYFDTEIDYWKLYKEKRINKPKIKSDNKHKSENKEPTQNNNFDWQKQLDPESDEFFKEGDYTPPASFIELVRNPNDTNIKNWFLLIEKKNELSQRLQDRISEYLKKNGGTLQPEAKEYLTSKTSQVKPTEADFKRYRFRLYFESSCPHCQKMLGTMLKLRDEGFFIELKQIDDKPLEGLPFPVQKASKTELQAKDIFSWPVLFIGDLSKKVIFRINGYKTLTEIFEAIKRAKGFSLNEASTNNVGKRKE